MILDEYCDVVVGMDVWFVIVGKFVILKWKMFFVMWLVVYLVLLLIMYLLNVFLLVLECFV